MSGPGPGLEKFAICTPLVADTCTNNSFRDVFRDGTVLSEGVGIDKCCSLQDACKDSNLAYIIVFTIFGRVLLIGVIIFLLYKLRQKNQSVVQKAPLQTAADLGKSQPRYDIHNPIQTQNAENRNPNTYNKVEQTEADKI